MRDWCNAGMDGPAKFTASREAAASRAYVTRFWESPRCAMCFWARRRLSRRERMAGECGRELSGPLVPSLIRSYRAEARITANIAENAIHRGRPQFPVGRWTDRISWSLTTGALRQCQLPAVYVKGQLVRSVSHLSVWSSIDTSRSLQRDPQTRLSLAPREGGIKTTLTVEPVSVPLGLRAKPSWRRAT